MNMSVDACELGGMLPGCEVQCIQESHKEFLRMNEMCVGMLASLYRSYGTLHIKDQAFKDQYHQTGRRRRGNRMVTVRRGGSVRIGRHQIYFLLSASVKTLSCVLR